MRFDAIIYMGRFQPFHEGHLHIVHLAFQYAPKLILILGSRQESRTFKNIWTAEEREIMIRSALNENMQRHVFFTAVDDQKNNDALWCRDIKSKVYDICNQNALNHHQLGLIGHHKDESSYYLNLFPEWQNIECDNYHNISATPLREAYLAGEDEIPHLPAPISAYLQAFKASAAYQKLHHLYLKEQHSSSGV